MIDDNKKIGGAMNSPDMGDIGGDSKIRGPATEGEAGGLGQLEDVGAATEVVPLDPNPNTVGEPSKPE